MADVSIGELTASDGYRLLYRRYQPDVPARRAVAMVHGIQSHGGWYDASCRALRDAGADVFFFDRRGSGLHDVDRGHCEGGRRLLGDLEECVQHVRQQCPGLAIAMVAISWGGKLAFVALNKNPRLVDAVAFICPGWRAQIEPSLGEKLRIGFFALASPRTQLSIPLNDPALFTATPEGQDFLRRDERGLHRASARLLFTSRWLDIALSRTKKPLEIPSLLFVAGRDRIVDNPGNLAFFERFGGRESRVIVYPDAHHTLEFERDRSRYFVDLANWLDYRLPVHESGAAPARSRVADRS